MLLRGEQGPQRWEMLDTSAVGGEVRMGVVPCTKQATPTAYTVFMVGDATAAAAA